MKTKNNNIICPLDGKPCESDCPDRYKDRPGGGCFLTTAQELGGQIITCGGTSIVAFPAKDKKEGE